MLNVREFFSELSDSEFESAKSKAMLELLSDIRGKLRGYEDLSRITLNIRPNIPAEEDFMRIACVKLLSENKIVSWNPDDKGNDYTDYELRIVNRYIFEKLFLKLSGNSETEIESQLPNLIYYNPATGKGFVNGKEIHLKKAKIGSKVKPKEIFDLLYSSAPNAVPRKELTATLRLGSKSPDETDRLNEAFSNLRKRCGVTEKVISLQKSGSLNGITVPFSNVPDFN